MNRDPIIPIVDVNALFLKEAQININVFIAKNSIGKYWNIYEKIKKEINMQKHIY